MNRVVSTLTLVIATTTFSGCLSVAETKHDHEKLRAALNSLYENQVIDNLIRAANGMPFVQVDYPGAMTMVTVEQDGDIGATPSMVTTRDHSISKKVLGLASRVFTNSWSYDFKTSNTNQITLNASTVTDNNAVYDAYFEYLTTVNSLMVSCDPPPPGAAHITRKWQGKYYWVPIEHRFLFLRLALITSFQRGKALLPTDQFYTVSVIKSTPMGDPAPDGTLTFTLVLDAPVPNDTGTIEFSVDVGGATSTSRKYRVTPRDEDKAAATISSFTMTFIPDSSSDPFKTSDDFKKLGLPIAAKLLLDNNRPAPRNTDELLKAVQFGFNQVLSNQVRLGSR